MRKKKTCYKCSKKKINKEFIKNNRFRKQKHVFAEVIKTALSANDDNAINSFNKNICIWKKCWYIKREKLKCNTVIKQYKND